MDNTKPTEHSVEKPVGIILRHKGKVHRPHCVGLGSMAKEAETQISFFLGGHRAGISHVYDRLLKNERLLKSQGVKVVDTFEARKAIAVAVSGFNNHKPIDGVKEEFLKDIDALSGKFKQVVVISDGMSGPVMRPMAGNAFYASAARRCEVLGRILYPMKPNYFFGIRNPATFIPSAYGQALLNGSVLPFSDFIASVNVLDLRWSNTLERVLPQVSNQSLHVWRVEDYENIWRQLIQAMTGIDNPDSLAQNPHPMNTGMSLTGANMLYKYLQANHHRDKDEQNKFTRELISNYPSSDEPDDNSVWGLDLIEDLTYRYEDDWYFIERMEEIRAISMMNLDAA